MRLPKEIKILNSVYFVQWSKKLSARNNLAEIDYEKKVIQVSEELKKKSDYEILQALWHEIIHGYSHESGLNQILVEQAEEMVCESLSRLIIDITGGKITRRR